MRTPLKENPKPLNPKALCWIPSLLACAGERVVPRWLFCGWVGVEDKVVLGMTIEGLVKGLVKGLGFRVLGSRTLDFEVTREKKYRLLFHNGSLKEQVPKQIIQVWYSRTQLKDHWT